MGKSTFHDIFQRTNGACHFCGDTLKFERRRSQGAISIEDVPSGSWEVDHVVPLSRGGTRLVTNCLPACVACNHLRLHRRGAYVRTTLKLGLIARDKIKAGDQTGRSLLAVAKRRWPRTNNWPELGSRRRRTMLRPCDIPGCMGGRRTAAGGVRKHTHSVDSDARSYPSRGRR